VDVGFLTTLTGTGAAPYVVRATAHKAPAGWIESIDATAPASAKVVVAATPQRVRVSNTSADDHATVIASALPLAGAADPLMGWLRLEPLATVMVEAQVVEVLSYAAEGKKHVFLIEPS
jgi:hypothetical protein